MVLVAFMTAPFVAGVFIRLPEWARKSKDALAKFARQMPLDTRLEVQKMGFLPLPRTRSLQLSELRTRSSMLYLANLEHVPHTTAGETVPAWLRFAKNYLYTRPSRTHWEKTAAPEMWPLVLAHVARNSLATGAAYASSASMNENDLKGMRKKRGLPGPATVMPQARKSKPTMIRRR